jgi:hypothetical protein
MFKIIFISIFYFINIFTLPSIALSQNAGLSNTLGVASYNSSCDEDKLLPTLVICGRSKTVNSSCEAYTKPCTVNDFIQVLARIILFITTLALLIVPLLICYAGVMILVYQKAPGGVNVAKVKEWLGKLWWVVIYFILMLSGWLIVRTVVDLLQVRDGEKGVNTFLIDEKGNPVKGGRDPSQYFK